MPLAITYDRWIQETKRPGISRSGKLEAIDAALQAYGNAVAEGKDVSGALLKLQKAIEQWKELKDAGKGWMASKRNTGGIVAELIDEVSEAIEDAKYDPEMPFLTHDDAKQYKIGGRRGLTKGFAHFIADSPYPAGVCWKFHIAAPPEKKAARLAASDVLPRLRDKNIHHKITLNMRELEGMKDEQYGKFVTVYSASPKQAQTIVDVIAESPWVQGTVQGEDGEPYDEARVGRPPNDVKILGLANAYCRYGCYEGDCIPGPDLWCYTTDNRLCGWPPWVPSWKDMTDNDRYYPPRFITFRRELLQFQEAVAMVPFQQRLKPRWFIRQDGKGC